VGSFRRFKNGFVPEFRLALGSWCVLCHNVVVLIQSACELGIETTFWRDVAKKKGIDYTEFDINVYSWI
jgi:hypothetical protein